MRIKLLSFLILFCTAFVPSYSTHLKGGHITINHEGGSTYKVTLHIYSTSLGKGTNVGFSHGNSGILDFGDGTNVNVAETVGVVRTDIDPTGSTSEVIVDIMHSYGNIGSYLVSYVEANRNEGILNFDNSVNTPFYIESYFTIDPFFSPYHSPELLAPTILKAVSGQDFSYSFASKDSNDYSLFYYPYTPHMSQHELVTNYKFPENFSINTLTGLLTWDTKFQNAFVVGAYAYAMKVIQVEDGIVIGYLILDFQLVVTDDQTVLALSDNKDLNNGRIYIPEETSYVLKVFAEDINGSVLKLDAYSALASDSKLFSFTSTDSVTEDSKTIKVGTLEIKSTADLVRDNPYSVIVRASYEKNSQKFFKDKTYLVYTKDIELTAPDLVTETEYQTDVTLKVYPNPVADFLTIQNPLHERLNIKIFTVTGNLAIEKDSNDDVLLDTRGLTQGVYLINLKQGSNSQIIRLIKKQ